MRVILSERTVSNGWREINSSESGFSHFATYHGEQMIHQPHESDTWAPIDRGGSMVHLMKTSKDGPVLVV